tara:strand:- start:12284 stop:12988 length:705 start_codon:yes stop_codon:yes gene_type:complete
MNKNSLLFLLPLFLISCKSDSPIKDAAGACNAGDYLEVDGIVVIEAEKDSLPAGWSLETDIEDYTGDGYIVWRGEDSFGNPGNGLISYKVHIKTPGTYRFNWRSRITIGDNFTEHNDNWMKIPDADDFFAIQGGSSSKLYPHNSGKSPNPEGAGSDGWFKVYMNTIGSWKWDANTSDNDAHQIYAIFGTEGTYTILVSGRSNGHGIDRMVLLHVNRSDTDYQSTSHAQTLCTDL